MYEVGYICLVPPKGHPVYTLTNIQKEPFMHSPKTEIRTLLHIVRRAFPAVFTTRAKPLASGQKVSAGSGRVLGGVAQHQGLRQPWTHKLGSWWGCLP